MTDDERDLRDLEERSDRGEALSAKDKRRFAELLDRKLRAASDAIRRGTSGTVGKLDQMLATAQEMSRQLEAMGEDEDLVDAPGPITPELACELINAAEQVVFYAGVVWDREDLDRVRARLDVLDEQLARQEEDEDRGRRERGTS